MSNGRNGDESVSEQCLAALPFFQARELLKRQKAELEQQVEDFAAGIVRAKALADERATRRAAMHDNGATEDPTKQEFDNPVADRDGGDEEKGKGAKKTGKK